MRKLIFTLIIILFISGCATTSRRQEVSLGGAAVSVNGVSYIPANTIIGSYGADHSWDPVARKLVIEKGGKRAVFCVGTDMALVGGKLNKMSAAVIMESGKVMIPASFAACALKELFLPVKRYTKKKIPTHKGKYAIRSIVIDPGHGGKDPGAIAASGLREKDLNLIIARHLKSYLQKESIKVILTRETDKFISLRQRYNIANANKVDFFISIHANAARAKSAHGAEVYYLSDAVDDTARATQAIENAALEYEDSSFDVNGSSSGTEAILADMLCTENRAESEELAGCITTGMVDTLGVRNRGVKAAKFYVLKGAQMPSVLVEVGFLSNKYEAKKLRNSNYQQRVAKAIAEGILLYKHRYEKSDGFTRMDLAYDRQ